VPDGPFNPGSTTSETDRIFIFLSFFKALHPFGIYGRNCKKANSNYHAGKYQPTSCKIQIIMNFISQKQEEKFTLLIVLKFNAL
jgi:hypothetical protein